MANQPSLREAVFAGVLMLANRMQTTYDAQLGELTLKQWLALVVAAKLPQPIPAAAALAPAIGTSHQNLMKLLNSLAAKGFLELTPSPDDRRARQISITEQARRYFHEHERLGSQLLDELYAEVDPEDLAVCFRVLNAMSISLTRLPLTPEDA